MKLISRRSLLRVGIAGAACAGPYGYGASKGRTGLLAEEVDCPLLKQDTNAGTASLDGLKIAVMADFHFDETHDHDLMAGAVELWQRPRSGRCSPARRFHQPRPGRNLTAGR